MDDYERGEWATLSRIMDHLNTFDDREIPKKALYRDLMEMRPKGDPRKQRG